MTSRALVGAMSLQWFDKNQTENKFFFRISVFMGLPPFPRKKLLESFLLTQIFNQEISHFRNTPCRFRQKILCPKSIILVCTQQQNPLYKHTVQTVCFSMTQGTKRTNRPEAVKNEVLNAAACILTTKGIQSFTLDLVAKEAGVSKGGLLHHFANKKSLLDGLFLREMEVFRQDILSSMEKDPVKEGRAVRAYIGIGRAEVLQEDTPPLLRHLLAVMLLEPQFCTDWTHHYWETINSIGLFDEITTPGLLSCLAADGLSLWNILGVNVIDQTARDDLYKLIAQLTSPSKSFE